MLTTRERRRNPRVICDYPAIVEWVDKQGNKYKEDAKLANLSGSGLYMLVNRNFELGAKLSVTVNLSSAPTEDETPKLTTKGIVVRVEPKSNGTVGIAIKFYHYRFQ